MNNNFSSSMQIKTLQDAIILPSGAIYQSGKLVLEARNQKYCGVKTKHQNTLDVNFKYDKSPQTVVYLGQLTRHYGHFLLESLCRFWPFIYKDDSLNYNCFKPYTFVFTPWVSGHAPNPSNFEPLRHIIGLFGIKLKDLNVLTKPKMFHSVIVAQPSCVINHAITQEHRLLCQSILSRTHNDLKNYPPFVFVSRHKGTKIQQKIEDILVNDYKFFKINPTVQTFAQDIGVYSRARIIAGFEGTNVHNILFSPDRVSSIIFTWRGEKEGRYTKNQSECDRLCKANVFVIDTLKLTITEMQERIAEAMNSQ